MSPPDGAAPRPPSLFYSYAHEDEDLRNELATHLQLLVRHNMISEWHDREIVAGSEWEHAIDERLEEASVILLLVSAHFIASDYIWKKELKRALERHAEGTACVIPVILRHCDWSPAQFSRLQALPKNAKPVTAWESRDEAWTDVARGIRRAVEKLAESGPKPATAVTTASPASTAATQSTAGLRALRDMMRSNPDVKSSVEKFGRGFEAASRQHEKLVDLKTLHDQLHVLYFQCYNFVLEQSRNSPDQIAWETLMMPELLLGTTVGQVQQIVQRPSISDGEFSWAQELEEAHRELGNASRDRNPKQLKQTAHMLKRILALQPSQINVRLREAARNLPLDELEAAVASVCASLTPAQLESEDGQKLQMAIESLGRLKAELAALTREHDQWQEVDAEFQRISNEIATSFEDLELSWPGMKKRLDKLCGVDEPWAVALREEISHLDNALRAELPPQTREAFRRCFAKAGLRFYQVDLDLKKLCGELRDVSKVLHDIWGTNDG